MTFGIGRRQFISALGGATFAWPLALRAQQGERMRRIGVLTPLAADDPEAQARYAAFLEGLQQLGWTDGRNVHIDVRWSAGNASDTRKYAEELVALAPDVIFASGSAGIGSALQATRTIPIVFAIVPDPVGAGYVQSLSQPGGNATGFMMFEYGLCAKWLALLKEIAPGVTRAAVLRDPAVAAGVGQFAVIQSVAPSVGVDVSPVNITDAAEIERAVTAFAHSANGGLISTASALSAIHRDLIITLAARHKLPAVYQERYYVAAGGLISYGPNFNDQFRRAAGYVDRILKGEKPADLPVQAPTKYDLVVNLKTAKGLGLDIPPAVLARADEVIE
jgi:putative ABC transport system substrate-binding protein